MNKGKESIADLHLHGRFAISVSKSLTPINMIRWAEIKGLDTIGTGDFLHSQWQKEFLPFVDNETVIPTAEVSLHFVNGNRKIAIHLVLVFSGIDESAKVAEALSRHAQVDRIARPDIFMMPKEFCQRIWEIDCSCAIIPAHIFTPYFGGLGARGLDDLSVFGDCLKAVETGISADIEMCSSIKALESFKFVSFSDAHGLQNIGREATVIRKGQASKEILNPIATIECHPELGKYHLTGHRKCGFSTDAEIAGLVCPMCGRRMTRGVVERLGHFDKSDRKPASSVKIVPLLDILRATSGTCSRTARQEKLYMKSIEQIGSEYHILLAAKPDELARCFDDETTSLILAARSGEVSITPGYDGEYGKLTRCKSDD